MKFTLVATVLLTFSLSAFAVEYPVLTTASPDQVGFDSQKLHRLDGWIQNQIDAGYPSINLLVIKDNHIVLQKAWGYAKKYDGSTLLAHPIRATTNTMYDLASNTKMYATN
ncbi:penicillin binding protein PBP4B, partial [Salmonella enterica subsp. enterica serovar Schwarzengrund]|nr:penicillin binding protein PBP4B [Salmonella enterica subsp. enterica serovar Schwarzengrund]MDJ3697474.1 serine hydrolase [Salmonella enterica]